MNHHTSDDFSLKLFSNERELGTIICNITSFSNKSRKLGVPVSIIYTRFKEDKWQKETWLTSRWCSWSSEALHSACSHCWLPLPPPSPFPCWFHREKSKLHTPASLLLPGNTKNPIASSSPTSIPRASKLRHNSIKLLQPANLGAVGHPPIMGRAMLVPACRGYPNHGWGKKRREPGTC